MKVRRSIDDLLTHPADMQPRTQTPNSRKNPSRIHAIWRRIKDRLKLTWIGWFYICARRTHGGCLLMLLFFFAFIFGTQAAVDHLFLQQYESWDELPCTTGTLINFHRPRRGPPWGTLMDDNGIKHDVYEGPFRAKDSDFLTPLKNKKLTICHTNGFIVVIPQYYTKA